MSLYILLLFLRRHAIGQNPGVRYATKPLPLPSIHHDEAHGLGAVRDCFPLQTVCSDTYRLGFALAKERNGAAPFKLFLRCRRAREQLQDPFRIHLIA